MTVLLALPAGTDQSGESAAHVVVFDAGAQARLHDFMDWLEPQLSEFGALGGMAEWAGKLVGAVVRCAGLLHLADHVADRAPWQSPIDAATVARAIRLADYLIPHARAAFALMGADPAIEQAKRLLRWVEHKGCARFTKRDAFNDNRPYFKRVEEMEPGLKVLQAHGYIRLVPEERSGPGRKPSPTYEGNPLWEPHNPHNPQFSGDVPGSAHSADCAVLPAVDEFDLDALIAELGRVAGEVELKEIVL